MHRILRALNETGSINKTSLTLKTGLNYTACIRYVDLLKALEWIELTPGEKEFVTITKLGKDVNAKLWLVKEKTMQPSYLVGKSRIIDTPSSMKKEPEELAKSDVELGHENKLYGAKRIMIVDDEPDVLLTYKSFLISAGYVVEPFSDVQEAILQYIINQTVIDLVILDVRMPDVNGLQLYQKFKAINPKIKIMFVSSLDAAKELVSILPEIDLSHVLKKPVKKELFLKTVEVITRFGRT